MKRIAIAIALALGTMASLTTSARASTYETDPNHTFVRFSYHHFGYTTQLSRFDRVSGTIELDPATKTGAAEITIDTTSANTGSAQFNEHIQGPDFLDTAEFPQARFTSTRMVFKGEVPVELDGNLTLKGITKPVVLDITSFKCMPHPMLKKNACGADATTQIKRTDFNMGKYAPYVDDQVTVTVSVEAIQQ